MKQHYDAALVEYENVLFDYYYYKYNIEVLGVADQNTLKLQDQPVMLFDL